MPHPNFQTAKSPSGTIPEGHLLYRLVNFD
jgi:hypothetical protein